VFSREDERCAARQALEQIGASLTLDTSGFYRPARRTITGQKAENKRKVTGKLQGVQLEMFHVEPFSPTASGASVKNPDMPLSDLFPEAYAK
jgi:hypothetical protein